MVGERQGLGGGAVDVRPGLQLRFLLVYQALAPFGGGPESWRIVGLLVSNDSTALFHIASLLNDERYQ